MRLAIVGSRDIKNVSIGQYVPKDVDEIVSGGALGVDRCAAEFAKQKGTPRGCPTIKQVLNCRTKKKEYKQNCPYSFSHALPARYSVLHLTVFCRAVIVEK